MLNEYNRYLSNTVVPEFHEEDAGRLPGESGIHTREPSERKNDYPPGFAVAIHVLLEGKLNVDVVDVSGGEVRVEVIKAPRTFATPHVFAEKNQFPATFSVEEDVVLMKISKDSFFKMMHSMPVLLHNFLCVSTSCNKCTMTRLRVLSFRGIRSRYIYYLIDHLKEGEDTVDMEHNQVQLAEYFGVTRPALSKEINKLVDSGFIRISRNKVKILNKQALISML